MGYEVDFLAVGQGAKSGDAICLRFGNLYGGRDKQRIVVIDGGFAECGTELVDHIVKYYDPEGRIDLVVSTHPDGDHAAGLVPVLEQLTVGALWMHLPWEHTSDIERMFRSGRVTDLSVSRSLRRALENARELERVARQRNIPIEEPFTGLTDTSGQLVVVGPSEEFYQALLPEFRGTPEPQQASGLVGRAMRTARELVRNVAESWGRETLTDEGTTTAENESSAILMLTAGTNRLLFTADAGIGGLTLVADTLEAAGISAGEFSFVQVPHHGSRRNVGPAILDRLVGPRQTEDIASKSAFVSAAPDGAPKHPAKQVTNAFRRRGAAVYATLGQKKWHRYQAPDRADYSPSAPLPFYDVVED